MQEVIPNYFAVLVAGLVSLVLGFLWFGPLFGKKWIGLMKITPEQIEQAKTKGMSTNYILTLVYGLVMAYVLACVLQFAEASTIAEALQSAFWLWLGFIATVNVGRVLWEGKSWSLWLLDSGYYLVLLLINSMILVSWK